MDQDGLSIALALFAAAILVSGLRRGAFHIQFVHASRQRRPAGYWACAAVLTLVVLEAGWRAVYAGCAEC